MLEPDDVAAGSGTRSAYFDRKGIQGPVAPSMLRLSADESAPTRF